MRFFQLGQAFGKDCARQPLRGNSCERIEASTQQRFGSFQRGTGGSLFESNGHSHRQPVFIDQGQSADLNAQPMTLFMEREDVILHGATVPKSRRNRTVVAGQYAALRIAMRKRFAANLPGHFVRQIAGDQFRAPVPEAHTLLAVQQINTNRKVLQHRPYSAGSLKKGRHDWRYRLSAEKERNFSPGDGGASLEGLC
jgi:hypothetical protein